MTVNKSQGQTIPNVGVYLPEPVFSHGQLYVAMSRATARANIRILVVPPNAEAEEEDDEEKANSMGKKNKDKKKHRAATKNIKKNISVLDGTYTKNIVYKEVLTR